MERRGGDIPGRENGKSQGKKVCVPGTSRSVWLQHRRTVRGQTGKGHWVQTGSVEYNTNDSNLARISYDLEQHFPHAHRERKAQGNLVAHQNFIALTAKILERLLAYHTSQEHSMMILMKGQSS